MASFFKSPKKGHSHASPKPKLPSNCESCHRKFGLFVQKHQCSKCKQIVCGHCSGRKHLRDPRLCIKCNPAHKPTPPPMPATPKSADWRCGACGFVNEPQHHSCFACSTPKQEQSSTPKPKESPVLDGALLKWWCAVCTFENQLLDAAKVVGKAGERVLAPNQSGNKDYAVIKSVNSDGTYNLLFDNLDIKLHVPGDQLQKEAAEPKCRICNAGKPEFSYPYWSCPSCTLANILSRAKCELCSGARPPPGPALMKAQQQARDSDVLLVKDSAPTPAKKPGDFTLLASDMAELQKQIELVKQALEKKQKEEAAKKKETPSTETTTTTTTTETTGTTGSTPETETKAEEISVTTVSNEAIAEAIMTTIAATEPEKKEKKKVKKGVRFGFADVEPAVPTSRLAYARATTLNFKKKSKMAPSGGGKKPSARGKFAITLKSEWLEAEMNVQKMMTEWDSLNKKAIALSKVDEKETHSETPVTPSTPSESPATSTIEEEHEDEEQAHFKKLQEAFAQMSEEDKEKERQEAAAAASAAAAEEAEEAKEEASTPRHSTETTTTAPESTTEPTTTTTTSAPEPTTTEPTTTTTTTPTPTPETTSTTTTTPEPTSTPSTTTETTTTETTSPASETPTTDFSKVAFSTPYASIENTPEPSPASTPTSSHRSLGGDEDKGQDLSLERELFAYLEGNKDRMKAFSAHSQKYAEGKMTAFLYYYMIGKTFGDQLVPIVLPLLLKALGNDVKKQEALRCYHLFAISKGCGRCNKIVYLPEEVRFAEKSWHRWCFKCTDCSITLDLKAAQARNKKIYCSKHVPKE